MTGYIKDIYIEFKLFELYGLRDVAAVAAKNNTAVCDFVPLAEIVLPESQARAFAARWPTLTQAEQTQICTMLENDYG